VTDASVHDLLAGLASPDPSEAWNGFLLQYSPIILQLIRRYARDAVRTRDCYQFVCEALSDDHFRRLRSYRPEAGTKFRTWLATVVANLCIDWQRRKRGRFRPPRAVSRLPEREQLVYHCLYVRGLSRSECLRLLVPRFPDLTGQEIAAINARLFALIAPRHRWQLGVHAGAGDATLDLDQAGEIPAPGPGPEQLAQLEQEHAHLAAAMARLPPGQRLLLRLRFEQDLTLSEVARLAGLQDPFRANRQIQAALVELARIMNETPSAQERKPP
jgi:RNA polymerase sigma factor (sigma-70 family)